MIQFSIIIPLYNKEKYIKRAIDSVLAQTIKNFELIIVNDGSKDNSEKIVSQYNDQRIKLVTKKNEGVSVARNTGIENSKAEYIAFLDADDEWLPDFLEEIIELITNFPEAKAFSTSIKRELIDKKFIDITYTSLPSHPWKGIIKNLFKAIVYDTPPVTSSSVCIHKNVFEKVGMFPIGVKRGEDLDTWIRIFLQYPIAFSTENKVIIHNDHNGGSLAISGLDNKNSYVLLELERKIASNEIPAALVKDANKTISKLLAWEIDSYLMHQEYNLAFNALCSNKMRFLQIKRAKLFVKLLVKYLKVL